ncbi:MAG: helix-turn-helix transcriptional regulator [Actinomycetota bacterium]|nr:helix-turn-helix transcriptional regulator [Actinomycetota bacterium]
MEGRRTRLARARKAAGYTQEDLAEALHVDRTTVHRWESGQNEPLPYMRPKLGKLLGLSRDKLEDLLIHRSVAVIPPKFDSIDRRTVLRAGLSFGLFSPVELRTERGPIDPLIIDSFISMRASLISADSLLDPAIWCVRPASR